MVTLIIIAWIATLGNPAGVAIHHIDYPDIQACEEAKALIHDSLPLGMHRKLTCVSINLD